MRVGNCNYCHGRFEIPTDTFQFLAGARLGLCCASHASHRHTILDERLGILRVTGIFMKYGTIIAAVYLLATPVFGHHSDAALNMESVVTFEGAVTEYSLRNPHAYFTVDAINETCSIWFHLGLLHCTNG